MKKIELLKKLKKMKNIIKMYRKIKTYQHCGIFILMLLVLYNMSVTGLSAGSWEQNSRLEFESNVLNTIDIIADKEVKLSMYDGGTDANTIFFAHYDSSLDADVAKGSRTATNSGATLANGKFGSGV